MYIRESFNVLCWRFLQKCDKDPYWEYVQNSLSHYLNTDIHCLMYIQYFFPFLSILCYLISISQEYTNIVLVSLIDLVYIHEIVFIKTPRYLYSLNWGVNSESCCRLYALQNIEYWKSATKILDNNCALRISKNRIKNLPFFWRLDQVNKK